MTIRPQPRSAIPGAKWRMSANGATTLSSNDARKSSSVVSSSGMTRAVPALLTRMSTAPPARSAIASAAPGAVTSIPSLRETESTRAPASSSRATTAAPIPRPPPVTTAVRPLMPRSMGGMMPLRAAGRPVVRLPADDQGRMVAEHLRAALAEHGGGPAIVCAQAGNVNSGAFDPFDAIADLCAEAGAWLHVDGAFGLWAAAAPGRAHLCAGVERADSWALDAHKWLNVPYDGALAIVRDPSTLSGALALTGAYLTVAGEAERNGADWAPEASRRARAFPMWAALRSLGRDGLADLIERDCRLATRDRAPPRERARRRGARRRGPQPGARPLRRRRRGHPRGDRPRPAGGHVLAGRDALEGRRGDADLRVGLADDGGRRGAHGRGDRLRMAADPRDSSTSLAAMEIQGARAIVVGGASGLGAATARRLVEAGAAVTIADVNEERGRAFAGDLGATFARCDVTDPRQVDEAVLAARAGGELRIAVTCAGVGWAEKTAGKRGPHAVEPFHTVVGVNLLGSFHLLRAAAAAMLANRPDAGGERGVVVMTASIAAYDGQIGQIAYAASKGGVVGMTLPAARDLAGNGVRVCTIAPGPVRHAAARRPARGGARGARRAGAPSRAARRAAGVRGAGGAHRRELDAQRRGRPARRRAADAAAMRLVRPDLALLDAAVAGDDALAARLGVTPSRRAGCRSATRCCTRATASREAPGDPHWSTCFFVADGARRSSSAGAASRARRTRRGRWRSATRSPPARRGRGLATAAARAMVADAFADPAVRRVIAHTLPEPNASNHILEKLGFRFDGDVLERGTPVWRWAVARGSLGS